MYDPALGRWHVMDPLTNFMPGFTPYNYCYNNPVNLTDPTGMFPQYDDCRIASTFIAPDGTILEVRDDGDRNIYLVHDPDNWDGSKEGLAKVGHTPEPATLKDYVYKNLYSEEVAGYMYDEAERLNKEASIYVDAFQVSSLAQLMNSRDEQIKLLNEMRKLTKEQLIILLKLLKLNEIKLNALYADREENKVAYERLLYTVIMVLAGNLSGIEIDPTSAVTEELAPSSAYDKIDVIYNARQQAIIKKYDELIKSIQNR